MTYYVQELNRIKEICFSNKIQIDIAVLQKGTSTEILIKI